MLRKIIVLLVYIFNVIVFRVKCVGQENIQNKGAYIICANHTSEKVLISSINRELLKFIKSKLSKNPVNIWAKDLNRYFPKEDIPMAKKMFSMTTN